MSDADIVLVHDPELVLVVARRWLHKPVVWDVHEDFVASVADRRWIPGRLRPAVTAMVGMIERRAKQRCRLLLAEDAYADRLGNHPVILNGTWVPETPPPADLAAPRRVVYLGRISAGRGARELIELGQHAAGRVSVELIGDADSDVRDDVQAAHDAGHVVWLGFLPNPAAMERVAGAAAGISLLHDEPNYRHSRPTKLIEYLAFGVPAITTALPLAAALVEASGGGVVVGFEHAVDDTLATIDAWLADETLRRATGVTGHAYVLDHHSWQAEGVRFVQTMVTWAGG